MPFYLPSESGPVKLFVYRMPDERQVILPSEAQGPEGSTIISTISASEFDLENAPSEKLFVCHAPGLLSSDISLINRLEGQTLLFASGFSQNIGQDWCLVSERNELFVQPAIMNQFRRFMGRKFYIFQVGSEYLDEAKMVVMKSPVFNRVCLPKEPLPLSFRMVLRPSDGWLDETSENFIGAEEQKFFEFRTFKDDASSEEFLISRALKADQFSAHFCAKCLSEGTCISLLETIAREPAYSYNFNQEFVGWDLIVFPFICFVEGLALIEKTYIYARTSHLSQSSGYGKTRLCFELLRNFLCGAYCVFRPPAGVDSGFPRTSPWMKELMSFFLNSNSDEESEQICLNFIGWTVDNFSRLSDDHFAWFDGSKPVPETLKFTNEPKSVASIISQVANDAPPFTIVIDECQEFLVTPQSQKKNLVSLYRAFRRAMNKIVDVPVVAVFVGTKSSLEDFVLAGANRPSAREISARSDQIIDVPPYVFTHSCNSMLHSTYNISYATASTTKLINDVVIPRSRALQNIAWDCGRPLWRQYKSFGQALKIADYKLSDDSDLAELTSLVLRTGSSVIPQDPLAHRLVLSGLATLVHVDMNGSRCLIEYVPEPLVANSARFKLLNYESFIRGLFEYVRRLRLGVFHESGEGGEHVGRICLLRLIDLMSIYPQIVATTSHDANDTRILAARSLSNADNFENINYVLKRIQAVRQAAKFGAGSESTSPLLLATQLEELESAKECVYSHAVASFSGSSFADTTNTASTTTGEIAEANFDENAMFYTPTLPLATVRQLLLLVSEARFDGELAKLGVSSAVLDGLVSYSQFVRMEKPLVMNQVYLMQAFARGCALIPPTGTIGIDAIIPVLRTDNRMSCIAVQFKNLDVKTFPCNSAKISAKLSSSVLNFLDFSKVGDFEAAPADDFVRLVIQFGPKNAFDSKKLCAWTEIPTSVSLSQETDDPADDKTRSNRKRCNALWLHGLHALQHLFFNESSVLDLLNSILAAHHDVYKAMDYPRFPLPTFIQTTEEGARFLGRLARPLANYANLVPYEEQMRLNQDEFDWKILEHRMELLQMPKEAFESLKHCKISPQAPVIERPEVRTQADPLPLPTTIRRAPGSIKNLNSLFKGDSAALSTYHHDYRKFIETINTLYQPRIEGEIDAAESKRRMAAQLFSFALEQMDNPVERVEEALEDAKEAQKARAGNGTPATTQAGTSILIERAAEGSQKRKASPTAKISTKKKAEGTSKETKALGQSEKNPVAEH